MARLRRNALMVGPVVLTTLAAAAVAGGSSSVPVLSVAGAPGNLAITNLAATVLTIARPIAVERRDAGRWIATPTNFNADAVCPARTAPIAAAVTIAPHATLRVQPWRPYSCSSQCFQSCRANIFLGAGPFRFVLTTLPTHTRVSGPAFSMPEHEIE